MKISSAAVKKVDDVHISIFQQVSVHAYGYILMRIQNRVYYDVTRKITVKKANEKIIILNKKNTHTHTHNNNCENIN